MSTRIDVRWPEIEPLLDRVLDQPAALRPLWLQRHCSDAELRALVQSLLDADAQHADGLEAQARSAEAALDAGDACMPQIPGYQLLRLLGEGGMASVFLAERTLGATVQRVALKRLRLNVHDPDERRRFEHEHRILARLEHPGIARLLDAGIAPDGVPWFAMEYVPGQPLLAWCDARALPLHARLALFAEVCAAVHHAHQHLVVHRDLKPSNIMVDDSGRVRLLDFGIARLEDGRRARDGTRTGERRLTPGYAAPEQFDGRTTTATDVYALGVVLVEMVTGRRPDRPRESGSDPLRLLHSQPRGNPGSAPTPADFDLDGDVGAIARKALRHDPADRYGSVQALQEDIERLRSRRPVAARRGDWRYRSRLFIARHRVAVAAGSLLCVTMIAATAFSVGEARRASAQAARAQAVQAFIEEMLAPLRSGVRTEQMPPLDEVLARGLQSLDSRGSRDPAVYSELLVMLARTYDRMGRIETARDLAARAYTHSLTAFGDEDERTIHALAMRGHMQQTFGDLDSAAADLSAARDAMQRHGIGGSALAMVLDDLGSLRMQSNEPAIADALFLAAHEERMRALGPEHPEIATGYANRARAMHELLDAPAALKLAQQAYQHCATYEGAQTRQAAVYLSGRGNALCRIGRWREGAADYAAALAILDQVDPADHPDRLEIMLNACWDSVQLDEIERAYHHCDGAEAMALRLFGDGSAGHNRTRRYRLAVSIAAGEFESAREDARRLKEALRIQAGASSWVLRAVDSLVSEIHRMEGDHAGVRDRVLPMLLADERSTNYRTVALSTLALACHHAPDPACPDGLMAQADAGLAAPGFREHPLRIQALLPLAHRALAGGELENATARLDDIETVAALPHVRLEPRHRWLLEARLLRGDVLAARGLRQRAIQEWQAAEGDAAARFDAGHPLRRQLTARLTALHVE